MAAKDQRAVAPAQKTDSAANAVIPAEFLSMIEADSGSGVKDMGMDDVAVPYLYVLQTNSPQVNPDSEAYVTGATAGMFYNNVSGEVYDGRDTGVVVIPCAYERKYVEWVDRDAGGGYVADHDIDSGILNECKPDDRGRPRLGNNNLIVETAYHYVYLLNPHNGRWEEIIIPMKSTFLKKSRRWNKTLMSTFIPGTTKQAPRWLFPYRLKTVKESRDKNTWSNLDVERLDAPVTKEQYVAAKAFAVLMEEGLVVRGKETVVDPDEAAGRAEERRVRQEGGDDGERDKLPF